MLFEARELKSYAAPVSADELEVGTVYFTVQFLDDKMLVPTVETLVFVGWNLGGDEGVAYFQNAESHRDGVRYPSDMTLFYAQPKDQLSVRARLGVPHALFASSTKGRTRVSRLTAIGAR